MRILDKDLHIYKEKIQQISRIQPIVHPSGVFEVYNVPETQKDLLIRKLRQQDFLSDINATKTSYNFNHLKFDRGFVEPSSNYTIRGIICKDLTEELKDRYRWTYSGNAYHFDEILGHVDLETIASSFKQAVNNFKFKAAEEFGINRAEGKHIDIDDFDVEQHEKFKEKAAEIKLDVATSNHHEKCSKCGGSLNDSGECPLCDLGDESVLEEGVQPHTILNPKLWDAENKLFPEIRARIEDLVRVFKEMLEKKGVYLHIIDAYIIGSNANYNYTAFSDLDVHIIVKEDNDCVKKHLPIIYDAYRSIFDNKYNISIKGISVELYVQSIESTLKNVSSGVYSVKENNWLKAPIKNFAKPEIDDIKFSQAVNEWERKYFNVKINPTIEAIDNFIDDIYALRGESLSNEGEFGFGNSVFKEIRNLGYIEDLKELKDSITEKSLSLD